MTTSGSNDYAAFRRALRRVAPTLQRDLPWIGHPDPWAVYVSEVMLQQTQTSRVVGPWERFLEAFPSPTACANAPLAHVLKLWAGLGFHRRAKALHEAAKGMRDQHGGQVPSTVEALKALPGIGDYTAHAVACFAFGTPVAVLDTNVGRVLARAVSNRTLAVREAQALAQEVLDVKQPAQFNQTMLDLGAQFCKSSPLCDECPMSGLCRWRNEGGEDPAPTSAGVSKPQSTFKGSDRQVRGRILAVLREGRISAAKLRAHLHDIDTIRYESLLEGLVLEGMVERSARSLQLTGD